MSKSLASNTLENQVQNRHGEYGKLFFAKLFFSLISLSSLISCLPLPQTYGDFENQGVMLSGEGKYVSILIDADNYPSKPLILSGVSYAEHESGKRYPLIINPEEYNGYRNRLYVKHDFLLLKASGNSISRFRSWDDGFWTIYLKLKCGEKIFDKHVSFELDTFYFNPLIHGAPN